MNDIFSQRKDCIIPGIILGINMEKKYKIAIDFINLILRFLASYCFIIVLSYWLFNDTIRLYTSIIWIIIPLYFWILREFIHSLLPFFLLHCVALIVSPFLFHYIEENIIFTIFCTSEMLFSFIGKQNNLERSKYNTSSFTFVQIPVAYLLSIYLKLTIVSHVIFIVAICFFLLYLINQYLVNFLDFYQSNKDFSNLPIQQIMAINHSLLSFFILLLLVAISLFPKILDRLFMNLLYRFLTFGKSPMESSNLPKVLEKIINPNNLSPSEPSASSNISQLIVDIFFTTLQILFYIFVLASIVTFIYKLYCFFRKNKKQKMDTKEFLFPFEKKESIEDNKKHRSKKYTFSFLRKDNNEKIRYMFYKKVLSTFPKNFNIPTYLTPKELTQLSQEKDVPWYEITKYYEKARYGHKLCSDQEVKNVKQLIHKKNK